MRFQFTTLLAAASLFTTGGLSAPAPTPIDSLQQEKAAADPESPVLLEARQDSSGGGVSVAAGVSIYISLQNCNSQVRNHTGAINQTVNGVGGVGGAGATWLQQNGAIQTVRYELNVIGGILAATTQQLAAVGSNAGADLGQLVAILLQIVYEIMYTLQNVVVQIGPASALVLGIIINNVVTLLAGLLLSVEALAHGSLQLVWNGVNGVLGTFNATIAPIIQGLGYLLGFK